MIRELVLVSGDLAASPWFHRGAPPALPVPAGFSVRTLSRDAPAGLFGEGPVPPGEAARRLGEGDTCLVVFTSSAGVAAQMWCSEQTRFIDWIGCNIRPPEGHVHVYNSWVRPEFRGLGLQWNLAVESCVDILARGRSRMCAGVERKEYPPFARKYAAMGLGLMTPYKCVWSLRLFGVAAVAVPSRPPRILDAASRNAAKILERRTRRAGTEGGGAAGEAEQH